MMLRGTSCALARSFRANLKYPSLVSYNKLPWEVVNHDSTKLHMHLAPNYEQLLTLAAVTDVPHLTLASHLIVSEAERLRVMPGVVYLLGGQAAHENPSGFTAYRIADPTSLQYYGRIHHNLAPIRRVDMCTSADLRLLCLAMHFDGVLTNTSAGSTLDGVTTASQEGCFSLFYFFRPNRPANELTQPFEKFYQHRPSLASLDAFNAASPGKAESWTPVLQVPRRTAERARLTPAEPYRPPQNYLMGLAERLGVRPGNCFGRRSLMWGTWF
ncbi:conserved hypothetical protein [Leishmania mexicana MHOM/GT/2001/U1103]|uniref:Uncharacterized protein n=1 Tax=Leishmania mexicana (strain MHOM/GT/2001/U1103) TaxID=929439 RepID=E9AM90_LEIMU|nr:conserved hypothetical protein [Leishmania mexicana MHOM/GT/2001/U1103]CBZ24045.1 conserved hypothetical protein [Leishmania mexicana MHOM/GT/2001/U1103]